MSRRTLFYWIFSAIACHPCGHGRNIQEWWKNRQARLHTHLGVTSTPDGTTHGQWLSMERTPLEIKKKRIRHNATIRTRVIAAAIELLIENFPIFSEVSNSTSGFPITARTADTSILVRTELKYQARNSIIAETDAIMIYFASLFIIW